MIHAKAQHNYITVWYWLIGLLLASVLVTYLPLVKSLMIFLVFLMAVVKALLVALNYMHLKSEQLLIYTLVIGPLVLFCVLLIVLFDDITFP
jgi:caa(3)-type oxidase subunit IV